MCQMPIAQHLGTVAQPVYFQSFKFGSQVLVTSFVALNSSVYIPLTKKALFCKSIFACPHSRSQSTNRFFRMCITFYILITMLNFRCHYLVVVGHNLAQFSAWVYQVSGMLQEKREARNLHRQDLAGERTFKNTFSWR